MKEFSRPTSVFVKRGTSAATTLGSTYERKVDKWHGKKMATKVRILVDRQRSFELAKETVKREEAMKQKLRQLESEERLRQRNILEERKMKYLEDRDKMRMMLDKLKNKEQEISFGSMYLTDIYTDFTNRAKTPSKRSGSRSYEALDKSTQLLAFGAVNNENKIRVTHEFLRDGSRIKVLKGNFVEVFQPLSVSSAILNHREPSATPEAKRRTSVPENEAPRVLSAIGKGKTLSNLSSKKMVDTVVKKEKKLTFGSTKELTVDEIRRVREHALVKLENEMIEASKEEKDDPLSIATNQESKKASSITFEEPALSASTSAASLAEDEEDDLANLALHKKAYMTSLDLLKKKVKVTENPLISRRKSYLPNPNENNWTPPVVTKEMEDLASMNENGKLRKKTIFDSSESIDEIEPLTESTGAEAKDSYLASFDEKKGDKLDKIRKSAKLTKDSLELFLFTEHLCHQENLTIGEITATVGRYQYQKSLEQKYGNRIPNTSKVGGSQEWLNQLYQKPAISGTNGETSWLVATDVDEKRPRSHIHVFAPTTYIRDPGQLQKSKAWIHQENELIETIKDLDMLLINRRSSAYVASTDSLMSEIEAKFESVFKD